jgi:hypothetical protein
MRRSFPSRRRPTPESLAVSIRAGILSQPGEYLLRIAGKNITVFPDVSEEVASAAPALTPA